MFQNERREKIYQLIQENGSCRVGDLKHLFNVSEPTIRNDLKSLEKKGLIIRQHGGAVTRTKKSNFTFLELQDRGFTENKKRIGLKAAEFVKNGDSIILDSGTTVSEMAKNLNKKINLSIVTNALNIAINLGAEPTNKILVVGGEFKPPTMSLTGETGLSLFKDIYVEKLFLATGGLSIQAGLTYPSFTDIEIKKSMIESAKTVFLLADSSKIEKIQFATLCSISKINYLITDEGIQPEYIERLKLMGIVVIVC